MQLLIRGQTLTHSDSGREGDRFGRFVPDIWPSTWVPYATGPELFELDVHQVLYLLAVVVWA